MASQPPADVPTDTTPAADTSENSASQLATLYADDTPRDDTPPASDVQSDAEQTQEQQEESSVDLPPIDAPVSWAKDAKEVFAGLPREAQEVIATRERDREAFVQAKSREAAQTRQAVESEARDVIRRNAEGYAQQLEAYIPQLQVQAPDIRLLQSGDPQHHALYNEQDRQYRLATAQREEITQQAQQARAQAQQVVEQQQALAMQAEHQALEEKLGSEWSDPSARAKLLGDLEPIAAELGYSQEVMAQAGAADILALRTALDWKRKAEKFDQQNKAKMIPVREARQIPPATRPGTPQAQQGPRSTLDVLYPNDVRR